MLIRTRTIVAALWDFELLHSGLLAEPYGLENGVDQNLSVNQPLNGDMTKASMDTQELLCPQHCFMEWFCNTSPGGKEHASAMFLLLGFLFGSLAWYAQFPLPFYKSFLRKQAMAELQAPQTCPLVKYVCLLC